MVILLDPGQSGATERLAGRPLPKSFFVNKHRRQGIVERTLRKRGRDLPRSVRLRAGELDYFGPLLGFFRDALSVLAGRQRKHLAAKLGKACLDRRVGEGDVDLPVERVDDFGRRVLRRADAGPRARLETRHKVAKWRDLRK